MRTMLALLLLVAPAVAGPFDWETVEHGDSLVDALANDASAGNATTLIVESSPCRTNVLVKAQVDWLTSDQSGVGAARSVIWFTLRFVGSPEAIDHRWRIETRIRGGGRADAYANLDADTWAESVQYTTITGDVDNRAIGQLGVDDDGGVGFSLSLPAGIKVDLAKANRGQEHDVFTIDQQKAAQGTGAACRIRIEDYAKAACGADSTLGAGFAQAEGRTRTDVLMTGSARLPGGELVTDTFSIDQDLLVDFLDHDVTTPNGGMRHEDGIPTDVPSDEERQPPAPTPEEPPAPEPEPDQPATEPEPEPPAGGDTADSAGGASDTAESTDDPDGEPPAPEEPAPPEGEPTPPAGD